MHIYWRIQSDLNEFGNQLILKHPNLSREFEKWVRRNASGLAMAEGFTWNTMEPFCLSSN
jgi:hypothetical protein